MKPSLPLLVLVMACPCLVGCGSKWTAYSSPEGGFRVELPGQPLEERRDEALPEGPLTSHIVQANIPTLACAVCYRDASEEGSELPSIVAKNQLVAAHGGQVLSETPVSVGGLEGVQWELAIKPKGFATVRTFTKGERRYELVAVRENARAEEPDVRRFLDSFQLLE